MAEQISRKQFFRQAFLQTTQFSAELLEAFQPSANARPTPSKHPFETDFPPELLAEEASRLGIAPDDKAAVLAAISERLGVPRT